MRDITVDNEVGNSAKLFHLECLRCSILKVSLDSVCQCWDEQGKCEDGMKCGICSCRLCGYTPRWMLVLLTHWQCNVCPWGPTPAHWLVTIPMYHQWVQHSGPRECLPPHNVSWMSNQSCSIIIDNLLEQKPFDFRHLREVCKLSVSSDNDCRPLCCPIVQHCVHTWLRALLSTHHQLVLNTWAVQTCGPKSSRGFKNDFTEWNSNKLDINRVQKYVIIDHSKTIKKWPCISGISRTTTSKLHWRWAFLQYFTICL